MVFGAALFVWLLNALASCLRGSGEMLLPAAVVLVGEVLHVALSASLIFGLGPMPALGVAGAGLSLAVVNMLRAAVLGGVCLLASKWAAAQRARLQPTPSRVRGHPARRPAWLDQHAADEPERADRDRSGGRLRHLRAGRLRHGRAARVPADPARLRPGHGAGHARRHQHRRRRLCARGGCHGWAQLLAGAVTGTVGLLGALFPMAWMGLFSVEPAVHAVGTTYLQIVGPTYGFFGFGLALYFASQGTGRLIWPLLVGWCACRLSPSASLVVLALGGTLPMAFAALAVALVAYGAIVGGAVASGVWFRRSGAARPPVPAAATP